MSTNISTINKNVNPSTAAVANSFIKGNDTNFLQLAVVVDIILDDTHPFFGINSNNSNSKPPPTVKYQQIPINYENKIPVPSNTDFSYIGRAKIRILSEEKQTAYEKLPWAIPLDNTITQFPLLNEQVLVLKIGENYYYTKPFNRLNFLGTNGDFVTEKSSSDDGNSAIPYFKPKNRKSYVSHPSFLPLNQNGYFGNYFILNPYIRGVRQFEGDTIIESRFGQSIRFSAYDDNRLIDKGFGSSYTLDGNLLKDSSLGGYGNPKLTLRNRQRNISQNKVQQLHPKLPPIPSITDKGKNYGGQIDEDINNDGSTIQFTSGYTESSWKTTVYKSIFGVTTDKKPTEDQVKFNPPNSTTFVFPSLNGDQIVINTDRLVLSSRFAETFHFSKKRYAVATDSEYTVDANDQVVITTNNTATINAPQIFLGQYGETNEPALLGQTTVDWMYDLCNWLLDHVHWYHHVHPHPHGHEDAGKIDAENTNDANPDQTQIPVQQIKLKLLRDNLHKTLSRRVFVTGGGYAPGSNGVKPTGSGGECKDPVNINTVTGDGVVGDFKGRNRREGPVQVEFEFEN
jgi:hypothetical protein